MPDKNQDAIGRTMEKLAQKQPKAEQLFYDPQSGMLESRKENERVRDSDRLPATQMAREGFFA